MLSGHGLRRQRLAMWLLTLTWVLPAAAAEVLLLVPGHLGTAADWSSSGVSAALTDAGWRDGGVLAAGSAPTVVAARVFYVVELPSLAPLQVQAGLLADRIHVLRAQRRDDYLIVVGHSAGGVVARLAMVQQPQIGVNVLVTIAAPNLGAPLAGVGAELARELTRMLPYVGSSPALSEITELYRELGEAGPGSLLGWLNEQPHPQALYVAVVRPQDPARISFDPLVPAWSQSLAAVPALRGRARIEAVPGLHGLGPNDARWLVEFLREPGI